MAWGLFQANAWRVRIAAGMGGVYIAGIEAERPIARLIRSGVPEDAAEDLIAACERGFVSASSERDDDEPRQDA